MIAQQTCERCGNPTLATIMSVYNRQLLCMDCKDAEMKRPDYKKATDAEIEACRRGDYNFPGIGMEP